MCPYTFALLIISLGDSQEGNHWIKNLNIFGVLNACCHIAPLISVEQCFPHMLTSAE